MTDAPAIGAPEASMTLPLTARDWAYEFIPVRHAAKNQDDFYYK